MNVNPFSYLVKKLNEFVSKSGDTMNGNLKIDLRNGTTLSTAYSTVTLGNNIPSGTDKNSFGVLRLYGENVAFTDVYAPNTTTQNRDIILPNKSGTVALTSDIPTQNNIASYTTLDSYNSSSNKYTCVSDGYIYLSNGTSGNDGEVYVYGSNEGVSFRIGGNKGHFTILVRKGMKCYCYGNIEHAYFLPLT